MVLLAFSLQDQVDKFGAYVGIAAFFGLAILTLLYFAQAREVKRLREWAGRAPERAAELEQAVAEHAEERRAARPCRSRSRWRRAAAAACRAVAATNGVVKLKPAEVAALAFARAAGVHEPHEPHAAPRAGRRAAAVAAPPTQVAAAGRRASPTGEPAAARRQRRAAAVPAPATPAARRADPAAAAPAPRRRAARPRARRRRRGRESNTRAVVLTARRRRARARRLRLRAHAVLGGDDPTTPPKPNVVATPTPEADGPRPTPTKTTTPAPTQGHRAGRGLQRHRRRPGSPHGQADLLVDEGYPEDNLGADTAPPEQQRQTSVVFYRRGAKPAAQGVADALGITDIKQLDDATPDADRQRAEAVERGRDRRRRQDDLGLCGR